jgi:flagellar assembly protein FliH
MKPWSETIRLHAPLRQTRCPSAETRVAFPQRQLQQLQEDHYQRGRRDGEQALSEQLIRQRTELVELHNGVIESLRQSLPSVRQECESMLVQLAFEVATRLVAGFPISADLIDAAVREAIDQAQDKRELKVLLNPTDLALLKKVESPMLEEGARTSGLEFIASEEISRGGCLVQTRFGLVDGRRESKTELLRQELTA